jgi:bifunctional UDP-N-acetylglucosamine pyrophosphorylase/glucosamine-1-phosphate N-acetyltransferase
VAEDLTVLIMAAGQGTRMRSSLPKVLHPVCGRPMIEWVIGAAYAAGADRVVCITRPGDGVAEHLPEDVEVAEQTEGEGTGSAILAARSQANGAGAVVVLSGDHPLISPVSIEELVATHRQTEAAATMLTTEELDPSGYGRVVRTEDGDVERVVETKHTDGVPAEELAIREINIGTYAFDAQELFEALDEVGEERGERYLTSVFPVMKGRGRRIAAHLTEDTLGAIGVNDRLALAEVEALARELLIQDHAEAGVSFAAPETVVLEAGVEIGADTLIEQGCTLRGHTAIGTGCTIGPHSTLIDARVSDGAKVVHSYLVECEVGPRASVGPFAYLRPETKIGEEAKIGTFVEVKKSDIGPRAKVPHLSYLGDADVGEAANVAAGNITANYDGFRKHRTHIGKRAKTGVDTSFVAPVSVGDDAYTGAGSVISEDVPDGALGISRPEQKNIEGYAERKEKEQS